MGDEGDLAGVISPAVIVPAPSGVFEVAVVAGRAVSQLRPAPPEQPYWGPTERSNQEQGAPQGGLEVGSTPSSAHKQEEKFFECMEDCCRSLML